MKIIKTQLNPINPVNIIDRIVINDDKTIAYGLDEENNRISTSKIRQIMNNNEIDSIPCSVGQIKKIQSWLLFDQTEPVIEQEFESDFS